MDAWYYIDAARERHGPLDAETLRERVREGLLDRATLLWREGMPEWRPLHALTAELGLPAAAMPPPLPPAPPTSPPSPPSLAPAATPPRPGLSGGCVGAIVVAVGGLLLIALLGIIAAIVFPAYRDYTLRAKAALILDSTITLQARIVDFARQQGRCPVNGDPGFGEAERYADKLISRIRIGRFDNGHCGLEATLHAPGNDKLDGKALWLDYDAQSAAWNCSSELDDRYLPARCRGG
ncbi:GYF domain-containing protein [Xanthomonas medicagonis]|uniref:GYF domain-containing protein n=1 Tax=Xanthomonas medicagonis TaxID=3160841 RepID=UPI003512433B